MASFTSRLLMRKPALGENVNVETDINQSMDKIDAHLGAFVCTSNSRPASPWIGMKIYETDTNIEFIYVGPGAGMVSPWVRSGGASSYAKYRRNATDATSPLTIANATWTQVGAIGGLIEEKNGSEWGIENTYPRLPRYGRYYYDAQVTFPINGSVPNASGSINSNLTNLNRVGIDIRGYSDMSLFGLQISGINSGGGLAVTAKASGIMDFNATNSRLAKLMVYQTSGGSLLISNIETWIKLVEI